jgi:hypothetical protein
MVQIRRRDPDPNGARRHRGGAAAAQPTVAVDPTWSGRAATSDELKAASDSEYDLSKLAVVPGSDHARSAGFERFFFLVGVH